MNIDEAIKTAKKECKNEYAQAYLQAIPEAIEDYGSDGFQVQVLYAYSNMSTWRGETARNCKAVIKDFLKKNKRM